MSPSLNVLITRYPVASLPGRQTLNRVKARYPAFNGPPDL